MLWREARKAGNFPVGERVLGLFPNIGLSVVQSWMHFSALWSWRLKSVGKNEKERFYIETQPGSLLFRRPYPA